MINEQKKPTLVFFRFRWDPRLPQFLLLHKEEQTRCLAHFFRVIVIDQDCDYQQICDQYEPDLVLFESGVNHASCKRPSVTNTRSYPKVPKIGLQHGDGFCNARAGFLSDMEHWGVETYFSISATAVEHMPAIADRLFVWPVFADPDIFHDYGQWKTVPVLFTGNRNQFYPWRSKILDLVSGKFPVLTCPHPGYDPNPASAAMMMGEQYARTINSAWFVPACGTVAKEVVRKHFEVPATRACLVTERSAGLEAAGFVDMVNCVFAEPNDVLDKLQFLFTNPERLQQIIDSGHELAHTRHQIGHRSQIYEWFTLQGKVQPGQHIVQSNPFQPLAIESAYPGVPHFLRPHGLHMSLIEQGDRKLWAGQFQEAEVLFLRCVSYMRWMPEPKLRLALCALYKGDPRNAQFWLDEPINTVLNVYRAADPDPVEWAYHCITLLCLGDLKAAYKSSCAFPRLLHPELDRARWAISFLNGTPAALPERGKPRPSLHLLPERGLLEWTEQLSTMLAACRQDTLAGRLAHFGSAPATVPPKAASVGRTAALISRDVPSRIVKSFAHRIRIRRARGQLKSEIKDHLHRLEKRYGYFLPLRFSARRRDELLSLIRRVVQEERIKTALLIGVRPTGHLAEAFFSGIADDPAKPTVFCIVDKLRATMRGRHIFGDPDAHWYATNEGVSLEDTIAKALKPDRHQTVDLVLLGDTSPWRSVAVSNLLRSELATANLVIVTQVDRAINAAIYSHLDCDAAFDLTHFNPEYRDGYAIFRRTPRPSEAGLRLRPVERSFQN